MNILIAFLFIGVCYFIWQISGKILCNIAKVKLVNHFLYLPIGFLAFFSWLTITVYPLILLFNLKVIMSMTVIFYYCLTMIALYVIISLLLVKYWLELSIPNWRGIIYFILLVIMFVWIYFVTKKEAVEPYLNNLNNNIIWYFNVSPLSVDNIKYTTNIFDLFVVIPILLPKYNDFLINDVNFLYTTIMLIKTMLLFSIYIFIVGMFVQFKNQIQEIILHVIIFFLSTAILIYVLKVVNFENSFELMEFVIYTNAFIVCLFIYYIYSNRQKWLSTIIGIITISFFSFDSKYFLGILILYLALTCLIQIRYNTLFIKDYLFITTPLLFCSSFVILPTLQNATLFIFLLASIVLILIFTILTFTKYQFIRKTEFFLSNNFIWIMSFIFVVVSLISILSSLTVDFYEIIEFSKYSFVYRILKFKNENTRKITSFILNNLLIIVIFALFIIFNKKSKVFSKYALYIIGEQFIMFYNPYSLYFFEKIVNDFYFKTFVIYENSFWIIIFVLSIFLINFIYKKASIKIKSGSQKLIKKTKNKKDLKVKLYKIKKTNPDHEELLEEQNE